MRSARPPIAAPISSAFKAKAAMSNQKTIDWIHSNRLRETDLRRLACDREEFVAAPDALAARRSKASAFGARPRRG